MPPPPSRGVNLQAWHPRRSARAPPSSGPFGSPTATSEPPLSNIAGVGEVQDEPSSQRESGSESWRSGRTACWVRVGVSGASDPGRLSMPQPLSDSEHEPTWRVRTSYPRNRRVRRPRTAFVPTGQASLGGRGRRNCPSRPRSPPPRRAGFQGPKSSVAISFRYSFT